ncbi:four helix bundle protein [bacterium SCSIO 12741]|nr:four helix bundle protein [bacterium SCSIO 12741]
MRTYDLEQRLIAFSISAVNYTDTIQKTFACDHLCKQLIRSSTSSALNYAESVGSESDKDFIHKQSIVLKELRETFVCLQILEGLNKSSDLSKFNGLEKECEELVKITYASISTVKKRLFSGTSKYPKTYHKR